MPEPWEFRRGIWADIARHDFQRLFPNRHNHQWVRRELRALLVSLRAMKGWA